MDEIADNIIRDAIKSFGKEAVRQTAEAVVSQERERCAQVCMECNEVSLQDRQLIAREIRSGQ